MSRIELLINGEDIHGRSELVELPFLLDPFQGTRAFLSTDVYAQAGDHIWISRPSDFWVYAEFGAYIHLVDCGLAPPLPLEEPDAT